MDLLDTDLGSKFSDESDNLVGWSARLEEVGIRTGKKLTCGADIHLLQTYFSSNINIEYSFLLQHEHKSRLLELLTILPIHRFLHNSVNEKVVRDAEQRLTGILVSMNSRARKFS